MVVWWCDGGVVVVSYWLWYDGGVLVGGVYSVVVIVVCSVVGCVEWW